MLKKKYKPIIIYAAFLVIMIITVACKKNFHVDEIWSYILSNNIESGSIVFEDERTYTPSEQVFLDSMAVSDASEAFHFANVWKNQKNDVHPPLYYTLLHIICSYCIGSFSLWYAASVNICFALFSLYFLRKIMYLFDCEEVVVDIASILFSLSTGILQNVSFLRMYVMAMFWVTLMVYLFIKAFDESFSWKFLIQIGLTAVAGALTHYYCIIYLCATCFVGGICLIIQKRWRDIIILSITMIVSGGASITIFPAMISHMFKGARGTQAVDNIAQGTMAEHWERIKDFYWFINTGVLGKIGGIGIVFSLLIITIFIFYKEEHSAVAISFDKKKLMRWLIIVIPLIMYFIFVSISAAYITDRYLFPIYAVTFGMFLCMMNTLWRKLVSEKYVYVIICLIGALFITNGFANAKWDYLYKSSTDLLNKTKAYSNKNCISVHDKIVWKEQSAYCEIKNYKSVTFISQEHYDNILQFGDLFDDGFMLNIIGGNDDRIINVIQSNYPYLNRCEKIGGYAYSTTYYISAGEESRNVRIYNYDRSGVIGSEGYDLHSNVMITSNGQDVWLVMQDEDYAVIEMDRQVLDVAGAQYMDGTNIQLYAANGTSAQKWKVVTNGDGSFSLLSNDERFALTCRSDGNVQLAEYHEEDSQKWWIE